MTTAQTVIDNAFAKSAAARVNISASPTELLARIAQCQLEIFQILSRENPLLLGVTAQVAFAGGSWARPSNCLRVMFVAADAGTVANPALAVGSEVLVVPYGDTEVSSGASAVYEYGQAFWPSGQSVDPSAGTLTLDYARTPVAPATTASSIDPLIPDAYMDIPQCDLAAYLAIKDARPEDAGAFNANKSALLVLLIEWARAQTYSLTQRFPVISPPLTNSDGGRQAPGTGN